VGKKSNPPNTTAPGPNLCDHFLQLIREIEDSLDQADWLVCAVDLMGRGLREVGTDESVAVSAVADEIAAKLTALRATWVKLYDLANGLKKPT